MVTEEVYTVNELAQIMGVSQETVISWRQNKQIPTSAMTPGGTFIKSVIDPYIEIYKHIPPVLEPSQNTPPMPGKQEDQEMDANRKRYPVKVRKEAVRLLVEEKLSMKQAAERVGCSVNSIQAWKKKYQKSGRSASPASKRAAESVAIRRQPKEKEPQVTYEEFVRNYWNGGTKAVDVLLLPPEIGPEVIRYVNEALRYAYDQFQR